MKFKFLAVLAASAVFQAGALTIDEPLEFETMVAVPVANISCEPGPFLMQRLKISLPSPVGRSDQTGVLTSNFGRMDVCSKTVENLKSRAFHGAVTLMAKVSQQTVLKLAGDGRNACEGAHQEIVTVDADGLQVSGSVVAVERELDCPAGIDARLVQTKDKVLLVLHNNGIPTTPKQ
jgi:hypothetical protein